MCGKCEVECSRLIVHMNGNRYCTEYFSNMAEFKRKYSEFRDRMSRSKMSEKRKAQSQIDDIGGCKEKQSCETKESEPSAKYNTTKSFPSTAKDKSF